MNNKSLIQIINIIGFIIRDKNNINRIIYINNKNFIAGFAFIAIIITFYFN